MSHHMHIEDTGLFEEEVLVNGRYFEAVIEKRGHDRIHFVLCKHQVAHHHVAVRTLGHGKPSAEASRRRHAVNDHFQVIARDVDLQDVGSILFFSSLRWIDASLYRG